MISKANTHTSELEWYHYFEAALIELLRILSRHMAIPYQSFQQT